MTAADWLRLAREGARRRQSRPRKVNTVAAPRRIAGALPNRAAGAGAVLFDGLRLHAPRPSAWLASASDLRSGALRVSGDGHERSHGQRDARTGKRSGQRGENGRGCHLRCQRRIPALDVSWRRDATNGDGNRGSLLVRFGDAGRSVNGERCPRCGSNWAGEPCVECVANRSLPNYERTRGCSMASSKASVWILDGSRTSGGARVNPRRRGCGDRRIESILEAQSDGYWG